MADTFELQRFVNAQGKSQFNAVCEELRRGKKVGHWIWYIFPQMKGLGQSPNSHNFGISSLEEASAYFEHPLLGTRLILCTELVLRIEGKEASDILGHTDAMKLRSCMTLFARAVKDNGLFLQVLSKYFSGQADASTLRILGLL